jgi:hypothetical protein
MLVAVVVAMTMAVTVAAILSGPDGACGVAGRAVVTVLVRMRIHRLPLYSSRCGPLLRTLLSCLVDTLTRCIAILLTVLPSDCHHHWRPAIFSILRAEQTARYVEY